MRVHNLYSDILKSITYLFDNIVYDNDTIRYYEFNIGNQTFQLDYKTQHALPAAIVRLQNSRPINLHPTNIQHLQIENINRIPVIYNRTKDLTIEIQEEHFLLDIDLDINCESQLQAKDLEFQLLSTLPLSKWFQLYDFTSFMEIENSKYLTNQDILNTSRHDIVNLFMKYDYDLAKPVHCFGISYNPHLKLDNCQTSIPSSQERSYQVNIAFQFMIQFPQYLIIPIHERPDQFQPTRTIKRNNVVWSNPNVEPHLLYLNLQSNVDQTYCPVIWPYQEQLTFQEPISHNIGTFNSTLKQEIIKAKYEWVNVQDADQRYTDIDAEITITRNIDLSSDDTIYPEHVTSITAESNGRLFGKIYDIQHNKANKLISGVFEGTLDNRYIKDYLEFQYVELYRYYRIDYDQPADISNYGTEKAQIITKTPNIFYLVPKLNEYKATAIYDKFQIKNIYLLDQSSTTTQFYNLDISSNDIFLDENGTFEVSFYIPQLSVNGVLNGRVDTESHILTYSINYDNDLIDADILLLGLQFDMEFISQPAYGGSIIERVSINIAADDGAMMNQPITRLLDNLENPQINPERRVEARLVTLHEDKTSPLFNFIKNSDVDKTYHTLIINWPDNISKPDYDYWIFMVNGRTVDSRSVVSLDDMIWLDSEDVSSITFAISKKFYYKTINGKFGTNEYPLFFALYKQN